MRDEPEPMPGAGERGGAALDPEPEYRRRSKPVRVQRRRMAEWARAWRRGWRPALAGLALLALAGGVYELFFASSWFVLAGSDQIEILGARHAAPARLDAVFASDLGRNVFFIPLDQRRQALEAIPWVRSAAVLRLWPARLQVRITERTPVAYARIGPETDSTLAMVDADGVLLDRPQGGSYDFPVLDGLAGVNAPQPNAPALLAQRKEQMELYAGFAAAVGGGGKLSDEFSEVDLANSGDVSARVAESGAGTVLVHFGDHNFAARFGLFQSQLPTWREKYPAMTAVDLRYDGEAIVDPGLPAAPTAAAAGAKAAAKIKAAKPAARPRSGGRR